MDALLGAAALGDIGRLFPNNDDRFLDADSIGLLRHVGALLREKGWEISNADCTVIAQRPKLAPYIRQMQLNIAAALELRPGADQREGHHRGGPGLFRARPGNRRSCGCIDTRKS